MRMMRPSRAILLTTLNLIPDNWLRAQVTAMEPTKPKLKTVTKSMIKPSKLNTKRTQPIIKSEKPTIKLRTKNAKLKPVAHASIRSSRIRDPPKLGEGYLIRTRYDKYKI